MDERSRRVLGDCVRSWLGHAPDARHLVALAQLLGPPPDEACRSDAAMAAWYGERACSEERWDEVVELVTNNESSFFREAPMFVLLEHELRRRVASGSGPIRILSAGCSAGQEVYSCAILGRRIFGPAFADRLELLGMDVDSRALRRAREGRYRAWDLRGIDAATLTECFTVEPGGESVLEPQLRAAVSFRCRNLLAAPPGDWIERFDLVLARNVVVHMTAEARSRMLQVLTRCCRRGGLLILAASETPSVTLDGFDRHEHEGYFYFVKSEASLRDASSPLPSSSSSSPPPPPSPPPRLASTALNRRPPSSASSGRARPGPPPRRSATVLGHCFGLVAAGDFPRALACAADLRGTTVDLDVETEGALWALEGVCYRARGDHARALAALERAAVLLPTSWVVHFHKAEILREAAEAERAVAAYRCALRCLKRSAVVAVDDLFLGGFLPEQMAAVCRGRISGCGGAL